MGFFEKLKTVFVKNVPDTSEKGKVNQTDVAKLTRNGILVGVAAALSYAIANISPDTLGVYQPIIMLGLTVALDFVNKLVKSNS